MNIDAEYLALCYLLKEGDENNKVLLSREKLFVHHRKQVHPFDLAHIQSLEITHRKIMIPLIVGGIMASLGGIALFKDIFDPYMVLITIISGLGLFYLGWAGQLCFTVTTNIKDYDFSISTISDNLREFIIFINESGLLGTKITGEISFFMIVDKTFWEQDKIENNKFTLPELPFRIYLPKQLPQKAHPQKIILQIDPLKTNAEVRFLKDPNSGRLYPYLMDNIDKTSITVFE